MDDTTADLESLLQIALAPGVGPKLAHRLLQRFGSPSAVLAASGRDLGGISGVGPGLISAIKSAKARAGVAAELALAKKHDVQLIPWGSPDYPQNLLALEAPPLIIYVRGALQPTDALALSVVGPRVASDYARDCVRNIIPPLCGQGITIVSGLAHGVDSESHQAALDSGGRTIAVLGQGLASPPFPSSSRPLAERIVREGRGAIISVFPMATAASPGAFPQRNEIIAALSPGTLVVEAGERSGALITARRTLELNRTVMALPGDIARPNARGSNQLLADGATLIQKSDDILDALSGQYRDILSDITGTPEGTSPPSAASSTSTSAYASESESASSSTTNAPPAHSHSPDLVGSASAQSAFNPASTRADLKPVPGDPVEVAIRFALRHEHRPIDFILNECSKEGFDHSSVVQGLLEMEMAGSIRQLPGRIFARV